jgi:hypothetical protein
MEPHLRSSPMPPRPLHRCRRGREHVTGLALATLRRRADGSTTVPPLFVPVVASLSSPLLSAHCLDEQGTAHLPRTSSRTCPLRASLPRSRARRCAPSLLPGSSLAAAARRRQGRADSSGVTANFGATVPPSARTRRRQPSSAWP